MLNRRLNYLSRWMRLRNACSGFLDRWRLLDAGICIQDLVCDRAETRREFLCGDVSVPASELNQNAGVARISNRRAATNFTKSSIPSPDLAETLNTCMPGRTA